MLIDLLSFLVFVINPKKKTVNMLADGVLLNLLSDNISAIVLKKLINVALCKTLLWSIPHPHPHEKSE